MNHTIDRVDKKTNWCYNYLYSNHNWWHIANIWRTFIARIWSIFYNCPTWNSYYGGSTATASGISECAELQALGQFFGSIGIVIGSIVLAVGIGYLVVSYGLLKAKRWAWIVTVILTIIAIITQVTSVISTGPLTESLATDITALLSGITAHIIGIAINGIILYYLYRPNVKAFFGKSKPTTYISK